MYAMEIVQMFWGISRLQNSGVWGIEIGKEKWNKYVFYTLENIPEQIFFSKFIYFIAMFVFQ